MEGQVFDAKEFVLDNGIKLISIQKETKLSSIHVGIQVGSLLENKDEKGICHFIEHMLFKGTKNRDNNKINQDIEERGGFYNAYTDYLNTVFSITALSEELEYSTEILSDLIINPIFPEDELEKERSVILAEIKTSIDDIEQYSFNRTHQLAFDKSPLKYDVIGTEKSVKSFNRENLISFYKANYIPNKCVISVVSPFEHQDIVKMIKKYFTHWGRGNVLQKQILTEKNKDIEQISYKSNIEQNTLLYLYTFYGLTRKEEISLDILSHKLGESPNSILFRELREKRGLAYDVYSQMDATNFVKTLYIYTSIGESDVWKAKSIIEKSINKIKSRDINFSENDISLMKKVIKTSIASILENSEGLGNYVLHQKLMGRRIDEFMDDLKILEEIKADDLYDVAKKILKEPTVHILLNKKEK